MLITFLNKLSSSRRKKAKKNSRTWHSVSASFRREQEEKVQLQYRQRHDTPIIATMSDPSDEWILIVPISTDEEYRVEIPSNSHTNTNGTHRQSSSDQTRPNNLNSNGSNNNTNHNAASVLLLQQQWNAQRQQQRTQLDHSIHTTFEEITREQPHLLEETAIQRAMELSLLDFALVEYRGRNTQQKEQHQQQQQQQQQQQPISPHGILGLPSNATISQIKTSYREMARIHHPDKGGDASMFASIAKAYRTLLTQSLTGNNSNNTLSLSLTIDDKPLLVKSTAHWDEELKSHRQLVQDLFQADGMDLQQCIEKQFLALDLLCLMSKDAGAINHNENNQPISNSCFYLSLATSYLWGIGALSHHQDNPEDDPSLLLLVQETALQLKRTIEAAVVKAHPEWCLQGKVGEECQAFSDFLVYTLDSPTLLSDWAVIIFDSTSGYVDVYKGRHYHTEPLPSNTITLRYIPGHYQALVPNSDRTKRPNLTDILSALDDHGVFYVVTDGNS
ncbi:DnaJ protein [Nitzschia inconspicua]|uniref:DnaJ protein n=1 Tax=Nitzschia inconspicua TaxID=303405 RepID=A0A9K3PFP0_9STRA|nr:DnaJ protein [Nitzschia inconspicua]